MSIYIPRGHKAMQGPCPEGFHIPSKSEFDSVLNYLGSGLPANLTWYLRLPRNGALNYSSGNLVSDTEERYYWTSTRYGSSQAYAYWAIYDTMDTQKTYGVYIGYGASIRPFKDEYVPNTGDGWTDMGKGIYHNPGLGLITIPSLQITLSDKNVGAVNVGDDGYYFQWGNNYGFTPGQVTTSSTAVNASSYGPGNYYSSSTFITQAQRDSSGNANLWGANSASEIPEIANIYLGTNPISEVYVGTTKVWPPLRDVVLEWLLVGGGGAGGRARCRAGGGGGAGGLIYCESETIPLGTSRCVIIGAGGTGATSAYNPANYSGGNSCFGSVVAYGGGGGGGMYTATCGCQGANGGSGGGSGGCRTTCSTGCAGQGNRGGAGYQTRGGGGGGTYTAGCNAQCGGNYYGGAGGCGCTLDISGASVVYASGGGGGGCTGRSASQGGGCGGCYRTAGCPATTYGSGGGGGGCTASNNCCMAGGNGCQGVFIARYPSNCKYNITGGTKYLCNGYCIHCFTSNGTLCIS